MSVTAPIAMNTAKIVFARHVVNTTSRRLYLSAKNPPAGENSRNGKRLEKAIIPGHREPPDFSTAIHVAVTVKIHMPPNEKIPVSQMFRKSE